MAKHDLITKDFALYVVHYFASMLTWSKEDILSEIDRTIKEAKPADAVPVVRCKDCEYFRVEPDDFLGVCKCGAIATNYGGEIYPEREHFCSYGERREGNG